MKKKPSSASACMPLLWGGRLVGIFVTTVVVMLVIKSKWLGDLLEHSFVGPVGFDTFPILLFALLLCGFFMVHKKTAGKELRKMKISIQQYGIASICLVLATLLSYVMTHPSVERFYAMFAFINAHPIIGGPLLAATLSVALFAPALPALFLFFPTAFIRRHAFDIAFFSLILVLYFYVGVFDASFHMMVAPLILQASASVLMLFSNTVTVEPTHLRLGLNDFAVVIGPVCMGLNLLALFTAVFGFLWYKSPKIRPMDGTIAFLAGLIILFILNILRIVLIMIVGIYSPVFAATLFHSAVGIILLLLVCGVYKQWIFPWMEKRARRKS